MTDNLQHHLRTLRPTAEQALEAWRVIVAAERTQVETLPDMAKPEDFYAPMAERFRDDPRRTDDAALNLVLSIVEPGETWLDVGAGGGRFALPVALRAGRVIAVEPSNGMLAVLRRAMAEEGIDNVDIFQERWPGESRAPRADVAFISHVGYDIEEIGPFLDQMEQHAARLCAALLFVVSPTSDFAPLWPPVHGQEKVTLPGLREFTALLYARGRRPDTRLLRLKPRANKDVEELIESARRALFVKPGSEADVRLSEACRQLAVEVESGVSFSAAPRYVGLVTWAPPR